MHNFVVEGTLTREATAAAVASAYGWSPAEIAVVSDVADLPDAASGRLGVELTERPGGTFRTDLTVYTTADEPSELEAARALSAATSKRCLVSDQGADPYRRLLVGGDGPDAEVSLDADLLDGEESFVLAR